MRRVSGEEFEPHRRGALRLGWRHESGAHGRHNNAPRRQPGLVLQPEARRMRCLLHWKKVACGAFFGHRLRFRPLRTWQKAWFLPAAVARSYARAADSLHG
jgi:hypothetical protein